MNLLSSGMVVLSLKEKKVISFVSVQFIVTVKMNCLVTEYLLVYFNETGRYCLFITRVTAVFSVKEG